MSADLHIHVIDNGVTEQDVKIILHSSSIASKYFSGFGDSPFTREQATESLDRVATSSQIWVGEVSWLKAALLDGGSEEYIPNVVEHVQRVIGEDFPTVTEELIAALCSGFAMPNTTHYSTSAWEEIEAFLREHMGKQLFTVSW
mgnify:CR=1 FL=1